MTKSFMKLVSVIVIIVFSTVAFGLEPAQANVKHVLLGGLAGAGIVLAWPTITAAVGAAAGAIGSIACGVGGAVAAGVGAIGGTVAAGGAMVGGAVAGVGVAAGSAVTAGFGAIGGAIAAITASPLFVPALLIAAAVIIGYIIYKKKFKNGQPLFGKNKLAPATYTPAVSASTYYSPAIATNTAAAAPAVSSSSSTVAASYTPVVNNSVGTSQNIPSTLRADSATAERKPDVATAAVNGTGTVNAAHEKYVAAYKNYINLLSSKKADDPEVQKALAEYKAAFETYQGQLKANE